MKKHLLALVSCVLIVSAFGCKEPLNDYLTINAKVVASDGVTPVQDLTVKYYDWAVTFNDQSTIVQRVAFSNPKTDANGEIHATTTDLDLHSGYTSINCYYTCIWEDPEYGYCMQYAEDCYAYNARMDMENVDYARGYIAYDYASSTVVTEADAVVSKSSGYNGPESWIQDDVFRTIFPGAAAPGANLPESKKFPAPTIVPYSKQNTLSAEAMSKVLKARTHFRAEQQKH